LLKSAPGGLPFARIQTGASESMQSSHGQDPGSVGDNENENESQQGSEGGTGTGEGWASAFARMQSLHDHRARHKPADDPSRGGHHDEKR
jgi:hypothetical protein